MTDSFPTLSSPRLNLREIVEGDAPAYRALLHRPEVTRYTNILSAPDQETTLKAVQSMIGRFAAGTGCAWLIEEANSRAFVGVIRFNYFIEQSHCGGIGYEAHPDF